MALGRTPEPSRRFHSIKLPIAEIDREWYRSHPTGRGAVYFGRNRAYRFDAPDGEYGVLYVGADAHVAFIESFQVSGVRPAVTESKLKERSLSRIRISGSVRLVNLAESGALTRIGADARIFTAGYTFSQRWSRAIHEHPDKPTAFCIDLATTQRESRRPCSIESPSGSRPRQWAHGWIRKLCLPTCWTHTASRLSLNGRTLARGALMVLKMVLRSS